MQKKKRGQHYVFQAYLKAWCSTEQIWCFRGNDSFKTNISNVAKERDFYRIPKLSDIEIQYIELFFEKQSSQVRQELRTFIEQTQEIAKWQEQTKPIKELFVQKTNNKTLLDEINTNFLEIEKTIDIAINNLMEDYLSDIEGDGISLLDLLSLKNSSFYYENIDSKDKDNRYNDKQYSFLYFLCVQYFRTKAIKERSITQLKTAILSSEKQTQRQNSILSHIDLEKVHFYFTWQFQTACAYALRSKNAHLTILTNNTNLPFITSDQPVINIKADYNNLSQETTELVFYYPISPKIAITVNDENTEQIIALSHQEVDEYNKKIVDAAFENIFACDEETLKRYCE